MLIMNQKQNMIIDTTKFKRIYIIESGKRPVKYSICGEIDSDSLEIIILGEYGTSQENAKKVLKELFDRIGSWENLKYGQPSGICTPTYEMPDQKEENQDA